MSLRTSSETLQILCSLEYSVGPCFTPALHPQEKQKEGKGGKAGRQAGKKEGREEGMKEDILLPLPPHS